MSLRYQGAVLSTVPPTTNTTVAPGIWTLEQQYLAQGSSAWPEIPIPNVFQNVSLLLTGDGTNGAQNNTFLDSSGNNYTVTRSVGAATQGTFSPYGTLWSNYFDGSSYLRTSSAITLSGDYTIECWFYQTSKSANYVPLIESDTGSFNFPLILDYNGTGYLGFYLVGGSPSADTGAKVFELNTWNHVAAVRSGSNYYLYINGNRVLNTTGSVTSVSINQVGGYGSGGASRIVGYVSNARVVTNALYTNLTYTVPTTPLTAVSGTSLLTCQSNRFRDASANNFVITPTGSPSVQRFSPFKPTSAYDAATIGASGSFSGSDVLSAGTGTNFDLGTGNFCMESWFYSINGVGAGLISKRQSFNVGGWTFTSLRLAGLVGSTWLDPIVGASGSTSTKGQWTHAVVTRSGTAFRYFVNGVLTGYSTYSGAMQQMTAHNLVFGNAGTTIEGPLTGYMTDSRLTVGSIPAAYTTSTTTLNTQVFTPPTSPIASSTGTILLKYQNAGIPDAAMMNDIQTVGNAQVSTSVKKYGTGSLAFDGTGDWLRSPASVLNDFGTGDFTIEFWLYTAAFTNAYITLYDNNYGTAPNLVFQQASNGVMSVYMNGTSVALTSSTADTTGIWVYYTVVRDGTSVVLYRNGTSVASSTYSGNVGNATVPLYIGGGPNGGGTYNLNGYIDDFRVTKGVALYTGNFSPPTKALPTY
jgi:hypothetical protein